jgi:hypothetical protein
MPLPLIMPRKLNIWEQIALQRGAQLSPSTATDLGQAIGAQPNRGLLLAQLVNQGKIKVQDLSPEDTKAAGANLDKTGGGGSLGFIGKGIGVAGGFLENLGSDAWRATKGFVPGIVEAGTSAVQDVSNFGLGLAGMSHGVPGAGAGGVSRHDAPKFGENVKENVIKPQLDYYNQQYLTGNPIKNFYHHPLGPILDVATIASLGAGGTARAGSFLSNADKISSESMLAKLGSTRGRAPLSFNPSSLDPSEVVTPSIDRTYSSRPLRKGLQILTDKAGERFDPIQKGQIWQARTFDQKMGAARKDSQALQQTHRQVEQLIPVLKDLSPDEFKAFDLVTRGINSPEWLAQYEHTVGRSLANDLPEGANAKDFGKAVAPELAPTRAHLPAEVKALAVDPTKSEALMTALQSYYNTVDERIGANMDPEQFANKSNELRTAISEVNSGTHPIPQTNDAHPFPNPTIAPTQVARNFEWHEPTRLGQGLNYVRGIDNTPGFRKRQGQFSPSNVTYQNVLQEPGNAHVPNPNPLLAGVHRPDPRSYVDLIARNERNVIDQAYSSELLNKWALKDNKGEPITVKSDDEAVRKYGEEYTAVHPTAPLHYYNDQTTVADMVSYMDQHGFPVDGPEMQAAIESIGEDTVVKMTKAARQQRAYVIPRSVAEYQRKIENASKPYENSAIRHMAKALNFWRTYTLSLMPRWALNTAVGSFLLNTIKGVGPRDYRMAGKLREGTPEHPNIFESPAMGGVQLGNHVGMEIAELGMQGGASGTNRVSRFSMEKVQGIEDYFRRASMVHSLSKEAKQGIRENGTIIAGFERSKGPRTVDEYRDYILEHPQGVRQALDDVDRFAYNFAALGPFERRVVRQIAPFWGWYRFISGVAYRLPVEYPGRANIIASISNIGMTANEKHGEMPRWLQGNIMLGGAKGKINYLSTAGLNPLSQIFQSLLS